MRAMDSGGSGVGGPRLDLPSREAWAIQSRERRPGGISLLVALLVVVLALQIYSLFKGAGEKGPPKHLSHPGGSAGIEAGMPLKDISARLQRNNLPSAAAKVLEEYLQTLSPDQVDKRRKTLVTLGDLLVKARRHEEALVRFFQAEALHPDVETQDYINLKVTECMEKLGKHDELAYEMADRTGSGGGHGSGSSSGAGDEAAARVVARIGIETITASDLDARVAAEVDRQIDAIPSLSPEDKSAYRARLLKDLQAPQKRLQVLRELVARKVLYREGMERELDRDSEVQRELERLREELVARQVVRNTMEEQIRISDGDLRLFYQANTDRYVEKAKAKARIALFSNEVDARKALSDIQTEEDFTRIAKEGSVEETTREDGGLLKAPVVEGESFPVLGNEPELTAAVLETREGKPLSKPVAVKGGFAIAYVLEKTPRRTPPFEEVRDQVARDYTRRKELEVQKELLEKLFQKHGVTIHTEAFLKASEEEESAK